MMKKEDANHEINGRSRVTGVVSIRAAVVWRYGPTFGRCQLEHKRGVRAPQRCFSFGSPKLNR